MEVMTHKLLILQNFRRRISTFGTPPKKKTKPRPSHPDNHDDVVVCMEIDSLISVSSSRVVSFGLGGERCFHSTAQLRSLLDDRSYRVSDESHSTEHRKPLICQHRFVVFIFIPI